MKKRIFLLALLSATGLAFAGTKKGYVFAAGGSTRFQGELSKLVTPFNGQGMVLYPVKALMDLNIPIVTIVGHQRDLVKQTILAAFPDASIEFAIQDEQLGTGHALKCARDTFDSDDILMVYGDQPLMTSETIAKLIKSHEENDAVISIIVSLRTEPGSYGRIVTDEHGITRCVEAKDFVGMDPHEHPRVNAGYYMIKREFVEEHIDELWMHENKNEYYINDFIEIASRLGHKINIVTVPYDLIHGVNTLEELKLAESIMNTKK